MRGLKLGLKWNGSRIHSFYCRMQNRVLADGCPKAKGPRDCPLRQNCMAYSYIRESANPAGVIHSP